MSDPFTREHNFTDWRRSMIYKVHGFWSYDIIRVSQSKDYRSEEWRAVTISWSTGGRSGDVDEITAAESFIAALQDAVGVARLWEIERNKEEML